MQEETDEEKHIRTTVVKITTENGAKAMDVPRGIISLLKHRISPWRTKAITGKYRKKLPPHLRQLIDLDHECSILIVGLGNRAVTADSLVPAWWIIFI